MKGDDPALLSHAVSDLVSELVDGRPIDLTLEEVAEDADLTAVLDASQTPAFLTDRRVVVVREAGRFKADEIEPLIGYLADPMQSTSLVLVGGGGAFPQRLTKAVKEKGHVIDASVPAGKGRGIWFTEQLKNGPVRLDRRAADLVDDSLGDDLGRLTGLLDALAAAYGEGATIDVDQLEPFLGAQGAATPWALTDAIDGGDTAEALVQLRRMLEGGQRHPLVVMATLSRHVTSLLRIDGSGVSSEAEAAALLSMAPFPAKKVMSQAKKLGSAKIARAVQLVGEADVDLRGARAWSSEMILEVLVARLSRLTPKRTKHESHRSR